MIAARARLCCVLRHTTGVLRQPLDTGLDLTCPPCAAPPARPAGPRLAHCGAEEAGPEEGAQGVPVGQAVEAMERSARQAAAAAACAPAAAAHGRLAPAAAGTHARVVHPPWLHCLLCMLPILCMESCRPHELRVIGRRYEAPGGDARRLRQRRRLGFVCLRGPDRAHIASCIPVPSSQHLWQLHGERRSTQVSQAPASGFGGSRRAAGCRPASAALRARL